MTNNKLVSLSFDSTSKVPSMMKLLSVSENVNILGVHLQFSRSSAEQVQSGFVPFLKERFGGREMKDGSAAEKYKVTEMNCYRLV